MKFAKGLLWAGVVLALGVDAKLFGNDKRESGFQHAVNGSTTVGPLHAAKAGASAVTYLRGHFSLTGTAAYQDWSLEQSLDFLKSQGVKVKDAATSSDVQKLVAQHADAAASVSSSFTWRSQRNDEVLTCSR